jgi:hypothetical protein
MAGRLVVEVGWRRCCLEDCWECCSSLELVRWGVLFSEARKSQRVSWSGWFPLKTSPTCSYRWLHCDLVRENKEFSTIIPIRARRLYQNGVKIKKKKKANDCQRCCVFWAAIGCADQHIQEDRIVSIHETHSKRKPGLEISDQEWLKAQRKTFYSDAIKELVEFRTIRLKPGQLCKQICVTTVRFLSQAE